ncbi:GNAT family N-acetyltransferase [Asticcacaulis sp. 201]|uniref:GNAT family N-acetyltransferase n=1 Tax=Asticcacaulis sp. 201 TaxID=3028787 RepID=UPI00291695C2|nr:GNAT family N-acetyltransferase [Asticcacaulis sp. 201]MDV6332621.1 GNAT family N-acetyltransferase [Asticcacaulis sp. 201]
MTLTPQTRPIAASELDIVHELAMQIWPKVYRSSIAPDQLEILAGQMFDRDRLEDDIMDRGHVYFVMRVGRVDVGFCCAHLEGTRIWVTKLAVLPDFRGFGLGKALVLAAQDYFAPADDLVICVHKTHESAVNFCLRSGFKIAREIPSDFGGLTDYVMQKSLHQAQMAAA